MSTSRYCAECERLARQADESDRRIKQKDSAIQILMDRVESRDRRIAELEDSHLQEGNPE